MAPESLGAALFNVFFVHWCKAVTAERLPPDVAAFADPAPGYTIVCSSGVQSCPPTSGQTIAYVGGTSAATPLVAGMIALWDQYAKQERGGTRVRRGDGTRLTDREPDHRAAPPLTHPTRQLPVSTPER